MNVDKRVNVGYEAGAVTLRGYLDYECEVSHPLVIDITDASASNRKGRVVIMVIISHVPSVFIAVAVIF